jgi:hypothetical protein
VREKTHDGERMYKICKVLKKTVREKEWGKQIK